MANKRAHHGITRQDRSYLCESEARMFPHYGDVRDEMYGAAPPQSDAVSSAQKKVYGWFLGRDRINNWKDVHDSGFLG